VIGHALVALFLLSGDLRVQADGTSESRAGEAPIIAGQIPQAFVAEILTPQVALVYRDSGVSFEAAYAPRIYWADPNPLGRWAPLLLHTVNLLFDDQVTPSYRIKAAATGSIGEPDYIALSQLLGTVQGSLPTVQDMASVSGNVSGRGAISPRWELELGAQVFYWRWLNVPETCDSMGAPAGCLPPQTVTGQTSASEAATALFRLSPRHELGFGAAFGEAHYSYGLDIFSVGPTATWKVRLTPNDDLRLMLGVMYLQASGTTPPGTMQFLGASGQAVSPVGGVEFKSRVARLDQTFIGIQAKGGVDFYADPILGTAIPRAAIEAGVAVALPPSWLGTLGGGFATPLRTTPLVLTPGAAPVDETVYTVTAAIRRRFSTNFLGETGVRLADRGPADFHFHQRQLWVYVQLIGTTRPLPQIPGSEAPH
jgi:hypothetical protein